MNVIPRHYLVAFLFFGVFTLRAGTIFPLDTIYSYTYTCTPVDVCLPVPASELSDYQIFQDGMPYVAGFQGCDFDTIITYSYNTLFGLGNIGPYYLNAWLVNGQKYEGIFQDIPDLVSKLNNWDPQGAWIHDPVTLSIKGGASGNTYSDMQITVMANQTPSTIGMNFGLLPQGSLLTLTEGVHTLFVQNSVNGDKDTLTVIVACLQLPPPTVVFDTISANEQPFTRCLEDFNFPGQPLSITNACPEASGDYIQVELDPASFCVRYQASRCNVQGQACIVVCDDLGFCDTTYLSIYVDNETCVTGSHKIADTLLINFSHTYCIDTASLPGAIDSVEDVSPNESGERVDFEYDPATHCVFYTGFNPGLDRAGFLLTDELGNTDTTYLSVFVRLPEAGTVLDTILFGQNKTYCIDATELAGNIVSIENFYPVSSGNEVKFDIDDLTLCVEAQSLGIGTDTAGILLCDSYGVCDTTFLIITVFPDTDDPCANSLPPLAVDDAVSTPLNTLVNIDILANDALGGCPLFAVTLPEQNHGRGPTKHGLVILNNDQTLTYVPDQDYCGPDKIQYILCNPVGCDTGLIVVNISCTAASDSLVVHNGFSPNGDGINDYFTIGNIDRFSDITVRIFNRWGSLVFEESGYKNNWDGKFNNQDLPTGTYFYQITTGKEKRPYSGYLQLQR